MDNLTIKQAWKDFLNWIESNEQSIIIDSSLVIKYDHDPEILYLYEQFVGRECVPDMYTGFKFAGIYNRTTKAFFFLSYNIEDFFKSEEVNNRDNLGSEIQSAVKALVEAEVSKSFDINNIPKELEILEKFNEDDCLLVSAREIEQLFFKAVKVEDVKYECGYSNVTGYSMVDYLAFIKDPEAYTKSIASSYLEDYTTNIYLRLLGLEVIKKALVSLEENKNDSRHLKRTISLAISKNCKSVNVTIIKDGKHLSFKTNPEYLRSAHSYYSCYDIEAKDRKIYYEYFGNDDYSADEIELITYGKKILYKKE